MNQKDIYLANLNPTLGNEQRGIRPIVIISGNTMNDNLGIYIACPIFSKIKKYPACVPLKRTKLNNLDRDSEIITLQIRSVSAQRLIKKLGQITDEQLKKIFEGLKDVLVY